MGVRVWVRVRVRVCGCRILLRLSALSICLSVCCSVNHIYRCATMSVCKPISICICAVLSCLAAYCPVLFVLSCVVLSCVVLGCVVLCCVVGVLCCVVLWFRLGLG